MTASSATSPPSPPPTPPPAAPLPCSAFPVLCRAVSCEVNKLNSEIGMVAVVRAISSAMGLPKPSTVDAPRSVENATA